MQRRDGAKTAEKYFKSVYARKVGIVYGLCVPKPAHLTRFIIHGTHGAPYKTIMIICFDIGSGHRYRITWALPWRTAR